ncbi:CAAX prenyl protease 2 [Seminavis robusta]|uniref:intramembrane prenyl-peptidase Rce1 n=1 Tax=Seminavis robusta TaxID=568900 RepID=A0A9N8HD72_9STRA|nr:CAAX prenyl protease 2 [Seminavis robusta]|eukprot:Sro331_g119090.1 CAAX prenyl protease 2 (332) ;mRNA; f:25023-26018
MSATPTPLLAFQVETLFQSCHHIQPSFWHAFCYGFGVAAAFVGSLYILVPSRIRRLDRDDPLHIQWRTFATSVVCLVSILVYPWSFCADSSSEGESVLVRLGLWPSQGTGLWHFFLGPLAHSVLLYLGPITMLLLQAKLMAESTADPSAMDYWEALKAVLFPTPLGQPAPEQLERERWIKLRAKVIAPILEEIAFRGCLIPPLLATGLFHPAAVAWIAPLFFGLAHCHHAALRLQQGESLQKTLLSTAFQFLYTTLFGAYVSFAFIRTGSIVAVILSHSFCNTMGLPSAAFLDRRSSLYKYHIDLVKAYLLGVAIFVWGFFDPLATFLPRK